MKKLTQKGTCYNPGWTNEPVEKASTSMESTELQFRSFEKRFKGTSNPYGCSRERRDVIFGGMGWKFDFSGALEVLKKNRGGRPRKFGTT